MTPIPTVVITAIATALLAAVVATQSGTSKGQLPVQQDWQAKELASNQAGSKPASANKPMPTNSSGSLPRLEANTHSLQGGPA